MGKHKPKVKAQAGGKGLNENEFELTIFENDFHVYYAKKFENLQIELTNALTTNRTRQVIKLKKFCNVCGRHFAPRQMSQVEKICTGCLSDAQAKPIRERRRFFDTAANRYQKLLRGALCLLIK